MEFVTMHKDAGPINPVHARRWLEKSRKRGLDIERLCKIISSRTAEIDDLRCRGERLRALIGAAVDEFENPLTLDDLAPSYAAKHIREKFADDVVEPLGLSEVREWPSIKTKETSRLDAQASSKRHQHGGLEVENEQLESEDYRFVEAQVPKGRQVSIKNDQRLNVSKLCSGLDVKTDVDLAAVEAGLEKPSPAPGWLPADRPRWPAPVTLADYDGLDEFVGHYKSLGAS